MANGLSPGEFWIQSPRSFVSIMEACSRAAKRKSDAMLSQAWHTEAFARMEHKYFRVALNKVFAKKPRRVQSPEEMLAVLMQCQAGGAPIKITDIN